MSSFERLAQHSPSSNKAIVIGAVVVAHVAALWAALQAPATLPQAPSITPAVVMAEFISLAPEPVPTPPAPTPTVPPAPRPTPKPPTPTPTPKPKPQPAPKPKLAAPKAIADPTPAPNAPTGVPDTPTEAAAPEAPPPSAATTAPAAPAAAASAGASSNTSNTQSVTTQPSSSAAYLNNPRPAYPSISRRMGEQGKVMLRVLVGADGLPQQVELHTSSGYDRLDKAAIAAVQRWKFVPGTRNGTAEAMWNRVPVNFVLE